MKKKIVFILSIIVFLTPLTVFADAVNYHFIYPKEAASVGNFQEGLMVISDNDLFGYVDKDGNMVIEQKYEYAFYFSDGLAVVAKGPNEWGYINKSGEEVIPCIYEVAFDYSEGFCAVRRDGVFGYLDGNGNEAIPFMYEWAGAFNEGLAPVITDGQQYFINYAGEIVIDKPILNEDVLGDIYDQDDIVYWLFNDYFNEGLAPSSVALAEKDGVPHKNMLTFIDQTGKIAIAAKPYNNMNLDIYFKEGMALVRSESGFGYIDKSGTEVIPCIFEDARDFSEGYAAVMLNGLWGYIDKNGQTKIPFEYDEAYDFSEGLACIGIDGKSGFIDKNNNYVIEPILDFALDFREGLVWAVYNETNGVVKNPLTRVFIDGSFIIFDQNPIIDNNRLLVPMRAIFDSLGAKVSWDNDAQIVTAEKDGNIITFKIGDSVMYKNDKEIHLEAAAVISGNRTMVPIRAVSEALNADVEWNQDENRVDIISNPA